ncbi:protein PML-like [Mytilus trossulus]|uniref:protein PML-like n=1 Tax=Mytilus trossulus TaxID=6551 RepID=UPI003004C33A
MKLIIHEYQKQLDFPPAQKDVKPVTVNQIYFRHQKLATREVREDDTYSSGIGLEDNLSDDIEEIPSPSLQPAYQSIEWSTTVNNIFFDIEATGLARNSHITQISATSDKGSINTYVLPKKPITPKAQEITGIKVEGSKMFCHDKEVKSVGIKEALKMLILFLAQYKKNVIIGHNIKSYDIPVLFCALNNCSIMNEFSCSILGFLDTLQLFKSLLPGLTSYAQSNLYNTVLNETYDGHDSMEDVVALSRLFHHLAPSTEAKQLSSFSFDSSARRYDHNQKTKLLLPNLTPLTEKKVITLRTANVIAASGMSFSHLRISYARDGRQGIEDVLKEEDVNGKVRVTKSKKIVDAISYFFKSLKPDE